MKPLIGVLARPDELISSYSVYVVSKEINDAIVKKWGYTNFNNTSNNRKFN